MVFSKLSLDERQLPVMPMLHVLSTHGQLLTFDMVNLQANVPGICSPPQPINDQSGAHLFVQESVSKPLAKVENVASPPPVMAPPPAPIASPSPISLSAAPSNNLTFVVPPTNTSTPAKPWPTSNKAANPSTQPGLSLFGTTSSAGIGSDKPKFGFGTDGIISAPGKIPGATASAFSMPPSEPIASKPITSAIGASSKPTEPIKPFLTVSNDYAAKGQQQTGTTK